MALFFPSLDNIEKLRVTPTDGEKKLLFFLRDTLDDTYEVFFQPNLNGDNPDIAIVRKNSGVMLIEVKDWNLDSYVLDEKKNWRLKNIFGRNRQLQRVKSPLQQVFEYKENLYTLHIDTLLERKIKNPKLLSIVNCAVYFHNAPEERINTFLQNGFYEDTKYLKFLSHFDILGNNSLTPNKFKAVISKRWMDRKSYFFDESLYESFIRHLKPTLHTIEQGIEIRYTEEQQRVIESSSGKQQKVKGVAGSGKTLALAKRAVNAHLRTNAPILILTFNISLRNYIHDRISEVKETFTWNSFIILHYHQFIKSHKNNTGQVSEEDEEIETKGVCFQTIIIDEVQDYQKDWITNVRKFLAPNGEFVVYGDEKQNIYQRVLEEKKPYTGISGQWNLLKRSFRVTTDIANLATKFQKTFYNDKYDFDEIIVQRSLFDTSLIEYYYLDKVDIGQIIDIYQDVLKRTKVHDNDVCFQAATVDIVRLVDNEIRLKLRKNTNVMFESEEVYQQLKKELDSDNLKEALRQIRRNKKFNFWMNSGTTKLSTIHSFKGWEIGTLFLIIQDEADDDIEFTSDELIYTAITRCRQNLIVINIGDSSYDSFFSMSVGKKILKKKPPLPLIVDDLPF